VSLAPAPATPWSTGSRCGGALATRSTGVHHGKQVALHPRRAIPAGALLPGRDATTRSLRATETFSHGPPRRPAEMGTGGPLFRTLSLALFCADARGGAGNSFRERGSTELLWGNSQGRCRKTEFGDRDEHRPGFLRGQSQEGCRAH